MTCDISLFNPIRVVVGYRRASYSRIPNMKLVGLKFMGVALLNHFQNIDEQSVQPFTKYAEYIDLVPIKRFTGYSSQTDIMSNNHTIPNSDLRMASLIKETLTFDITGVGGGNITIYLDQNTRASYIYSDYTTKAFHIVGNISLTHIMSANTPYNAYYNGGSSGAPTFTNSNKLGCNSISIHTNGSSLSIEFTGTSHLIHTIYIL